VDPSAVCKVPAFDPDVALLVGNETVEVPLAVLEAPGAPADEVDGPAANALRDYLASPRARHAPADGWRVIGEGDAVTYAAPPGGGYGDWWVVGFEQREGDWRLVQEEIVDQELTPAQRGQGLELEWSGPVRVEGGGWSSALQLVNGRGSPWTARRGVPWAIPHVFDHQTGHEIGALQSVVHDQPQDFRDVPTVQPGERAEVPLALGSVGVSLAGGVYDVVGCVPELALASPLGTLEVVGGPATAEGTVLTYHPGNAFMDALAIGTLTLHHGCLAVANGASDRSPAYVLWPEGYALVERDGGAVLIDPIGRSVGALGDEISLGGGYAPYRLIADSVIGGVPEGCANGGGGYFITGGPT
jgi:hypothetical protein